ncbi:MAG: LysE/ArgO family amino acid transporter [Gammaproteobacteria bacterium]|nr:LysE/ArgO family amino acid transporter [Gammaproteobacteria bacterium]
MYFHPWLIGLATGLSLIIAIGAQNAFVLKQGILKNHSFTIALTCTLVDALLITVGVSSLGQLFALNEKLLLLARVGGALFLIGYGFRSFHAAFTKETLDVHHGTKPLSLKAAISITLALSLLNPHVYLDACVLLGSIGGQFSAAQRPSFIMGSITASILWFFSLSYGARFLLPLFKKPMAWKILDSLIGLIMWGIAGFLLYGA